MAKNVTEQQNGEAVDRKSKQKNKINKNKKL